MHVTLDFESYSEADLKQVGSWKYWEHPTTEPLMASYKVGASPTKIWTAYGDGNVCPADLVAAIETGATFDVHGANFEQAAWLWCVKHWGWPELPPERWDDTMARCAALSLPLKLDRVGAVLHLPIQKDSVGKSWIQRYTRPQTVTKKQPLKRLTDAAGLAVGESYCMTDTETEFGLRKKVGYLSARERSVWLMDQAINQRGIKVDVPLAMIARDTVEKVETKLTAELLGLSGVDGHSKVKQLVEWLEKNGVHVPRVKRKGGKETPSLDADTVEDLLVSVEKGTPMHRVLKLRQELAKGSTKKLEAFIRATNGDGRVRYMFQYHGANTGRWAGRLINLTNLPRPPSHMEGYDPDTLAANIATGDPDYLGFVYGDPLVAISAGLRCLLVADKGKKFVAGDYKSVEGIGIAGLAGEESKLDVYRRGEDPYSVFATGALGFKVTKKTHPFERQTVGKPGELAFGFGGGLGAWIKFDDSGRFTDAQIHGFKNSWRGQHPMIEALWEGLETAALTAMLEGRGEYRGIIYRRVGQYLTCTLPSGRNLSYFDPKLEERELPWSTKERPAFGLTITYMSWKGGQWVRVHTYGGKLAENVTQAACRDVLVTGMFEAEDRGLPIVLHNYDEIVVEVDERNDYAIKMLTEAMEVKQDWYSDWPLSADPWEGMRYRK